MVAEFQEVMKQWRRMCMEDDKKRTKEGLNACDSCPLKGFPCPELRIDWNHAEKIVMAWAAEHPEPVYPTWIDVLKMYNVTDETGYAYLESAYKPIPADIAQKLGIEPNEG